MTRLNDVRVIIRGAELLRRVALTVDHVPAPIAGAGQGRSHVRTPDRARVRTHAPTHVHVGRVIMARARGHVPETLIHEADAAQAVSLSTLPQAAEDNRPCP